MKTSVKVSLKGANRFEKETDNPEKEKEFIGTLRTFGFSDR